MTFINHYQPKSLKGLLYGLICLFFLLNQTSIEAQTTINFDVAGNWTAGSGTLGSYQSNHRYSQGVFSATGGPALQQNNAAQDGFPGALGTYAWRLRDQSGVDWRATIASGGVSTFSMQIRRWDGSPSPNYLLDYSIDGGLNWSGTVATINNTSLGNASQFVSFGGTINSANNNIIIRLRSTGSTERIMVDNFVWTGYSDPTPSCAIEIDDIIVSNCISGNDTFPNGYYLYDLYLSFSDAPASGNLVITGPKDTILTVSSIQSPLVLTGLRAVPDGQSFQVNASFSAEPACSTSMMATSPLPCPVIPECAVAITNIQVSECISGNDTFPDGYFLYDVSLSFSNAPVSGTMTITGPKDTTLQMNMLQSPLTIVGLRAVADGLSFDVGVSFSENTLCTASLSATAPQPCPVVNTACTELFFSEYIEGSGFEKYVEIYNPGTQAVNLSNYELRLYSNGASSPSQTANHSAAGSIPGGGTVVLRNGQATGYTGGFVYSTVINHNGDDALELYNVSLSKTVDIFGRIGNDPGSAWTASGLSTVDRTLRRKSTVNQGVGTNPTGTGSGAFTTLATEWDGYPQNEVSGLGTHQSECVVTSCSLEISQINVYPCDMGNPAYPNGFFTFDVRVDFEDAPTSGFLKLQSIMDDSVSVIGLSSPYTFTGVTGAANGNTFSVLVSFTAEPACVDLDEGTAPSTCIELEDCGELFISEYIEGSGNNKCLEIFNPGSEAIDLQAGNYAIYAYFNGSSSVGLNIPLEGVIAASSKHVVCNNAASIEFLNKAQQVPSGGTGWYNGNDAVALVKNTAIIDVIGQIGYDPGSAWSVGGVSTMDQTLVRKPNILKGSPDGSDFFDPSQEWESNPLNYSVSLGNHSSECVKLPGGLEPVFIGDCQDGLVEELQNSDIRIQSNCWGNMVGREANFLQGNTCGNFEISAKVTVDAMGFAGIMFRESLLPDSRYVYLFVRANGQIALAVRSNPAFPAQIQTKPQANFQYMKMTREGNAFKCYLSMNGVNWSQVFSIGLPIGNCGHAGYATHSFSDGILINSLYQFIEYNFGENETFGLNLSNVAIQEVNSASADIMLYPNPATNQIHIALPGSSSNEKQIQILDIHGRLITDRTMVAGTEFSLDVSQVPLSNTVYLLIVKDKEIIYKTRFVVSGR